MAKARDLTKLSEAQLEREVCAKMCELEPLYAEVTRRGLFLDMEDCNKFKLSPLPDAVTIDREDGTNAITARR